MLEEDFWKNVANFSYLISLPRQPASMKKYKRVSKRFQIISSTCSSSQMRMNTSISNSTPAAIGRVSHKNERNLILNGHAWCTNILLQQKYKIGMPEYIWTLIIFNMLTARTIFPFCCCKVINETQIYMFSMQGKWCKTITLIWQLAANKILT